MQRCFVVQVHTGCELQAAAAINESGRRAVAPRLRQRRKETPGMTWRQKQAIRQQPVIEVSLFPGYILTFFDRDVDQWGKTQRQNDAGVIAIVPRVGERPIPLPMWEAQRLIDRLDSDGFWIDKAEEKPWEKFKVGQQVTVADGAFASFPAKIEEMSGSERIKVLVNIFGRDTPVELNWDQVEVA